jgi:hypothetical protein
MALATALACIDGDRTFDTYWKSLAAAVERARQLSKS